MLISLKKASVLVAAVLVGACAPSENSTATEVASTATQKNTQTHTRGQNLFIIGQDLDAIRGFVQSDCCTQPDGFTAYIGLYNVLDENNNLGGIGLAPNGKPTDFEGDWGAGAVSAYKTATEFGPGDLAIGLFIGENDRANALDELVKGEHDDKILQLAKLADHVDGSVFLRIGYEFDGTWNQGYENTDRFIVAWKRIVDILRAERPGRFLFVWQASASATDDILEKRHEDITAWYPGDDYVDWMALSWFISPAETRVKPNDYEPLTQGVLAQEVIDFARAKDKPVMIAEAAPQGFDLKNQTERHHIALWDGEAGALVNTLTSQEIWDYWYAPFLSFVQENDDVVDAIAYINANWDEQSMWGAPYAAGYWGDTRLEVNTEIAEKWNTAIDEWRNTAPTTK